MPPSALTDHVAVAAGDEHSLSLKADGPSICPGDLNCDDSVDFDDINPFVKYVSNCATWQAAYPNCPPEIGDIDGDGQHACNGSPFDDINAFVRLLSGG